MTDDPIHNAENADYQLTENYERTPFGVNVTFPEVVTIRMVDASSLGDYEFALLVAGFFCNASVGFAVAALTVVPQNNLLWVVAGLFSVITIAFVVWAVIKRTAIKQKERTIKVNATGKISSTGVI